ncbi:unnamed protein product [Clonostachys chloroleuca]|uniref:DNA replication regulator Sld3 C-terminal domain-containing protein n=1 Tax=Clonostachys chloroleuca TaxID=1926264 RepID=A0AA35PU25_9HYPO|nr:unnamed protein product [Clonostachys chloroleuca]
MSDADASSRLRSGIMTPSSEGSLQHNGHSSATPDSRKRKRERSLATDHLLRPPIDLKPYPPNLHVPPRTLHPLMLLPCQYVPLGSFDFLAPHGDLPQSRFFESRIKILDLESRMGTRPSLLLARSEPRGTVYAVERQKNGLYSVCKLGSWVSIDQLAEHATAIATERIRVPKAEPIEPNAPLPLTTPQTHKDERQKNKAIEAIQSLVRKRSHSQSLSISEGVVVKPDPALTASMYGSMNDAKPLEKVEDAPRDDPPKEAVGVASGDHQEQITPEGIFENIRSQYSETLYKSKGSLAYFAKGSLSRARSAFLMDLESNLDMEELIAFLKSMVLTTVQIDKKFRETIPDIMSKMNTVIESSDDGQKRRRRPKKMKLSKEGLYPLEDESIRAWWSSSKPELEDAKSGDTMSQIKFHASLLRTRETQLQMILIMEILALESVKETTQSTESNSLPMLPGAIGNPVGSSTPPMAPPKKRNKHNLSVLIDVHADRLTIWQSTASEEQLLFEDSQQSTPQSQTPNSKSSQEPLRDFCVDVIMPFYMARLPQLCDSLNRKLGGPLTMSQSKPRSLKRHSSKQELKPGAVTKRTARHKEPRTLERALSYDQQRRSMSRGPNNALALMRSATSAAIPTLKKEESDLGNSGLASQSRPRTSSLVRSTSMVDLQDVKANKKARVEAALKDAISSIRKPDRNVVGKAMQEEAERKASALTSAKKSRRTLWPSSSSTLVKATPANNRFRDVLGTKKPDTSAANIPIPSTEIIPPSSVGGVGSSTGERTVLRNTTGNRGLLSVDISCTPTKGYSRQRNSNEQPEIPPSSPLFDRDAALGASPDVRHARNEPMRKLSFDTSYEDVLFATPVKRQAAQKPAQQYKDLEPAAEQRTDKSIYDRLGWDDDLDDF